MRCPRPEARSRGQKSRRWSAVWRTCLSQRHVNAARRWTAGCAARRSIPLPLQGTEGTQRRASPGPRQRIRVAERWLRLSEIGCLTIESENRERKNARAPHSAHSPRKRESSTGSPLARGRADEGASPVRVALAPSDLILRRPPKAGVSKDGHHEWPHGSRRAAFAALLTMRRPGQQRMRPNSLGGIIVCPAITAARLAQ